MKQIANKIVRWRWIILAVMAVLTLVSGLLIPRVKINTDMTKYLPSDSSMHQGLELMETEFPQTEITQTIRVMAQGLDEAQKTDLAERLAGIEYVDHVEYEAGSEDYNRGEYTLYVLHTVYDYDSPEERAIHNTLEADFGDYKLTVKNDNPTVTQIPLWIIAAAVACVMVVLFVLCSSWIEPLLFLVGIGFAVVLNMGTNLILGEVSIITFSISAILQLALSMDYSIILMNRYRQERAGSSSPAEAMQRALAGASSSIVSSAMTTVVGLLALVFMSFRIGVDLGVVLAKGIVMSLLTIFTVLPALILACNKLIERTAKRTFTPPTRALAHFCYRFRHALAVFFVLLFALTYVLQQRTQTVYTLTTEDPIADYFPTSNTIVMLYRNEDETQVAELAADLQQQEAVTEVTAWATTLGTQLTAEELSQQLTQLGGDLPLDAATLRLVYYLVHTGGALPELTVTEFLGFLTEDVLSNETFSALLDAQTQQSLQQLAVFADPELPGRAMTATEIAALFSLPAEQVEQLFVLYFSQNPVVDTGEMTLAEFAAFVTQTLASNPEAAAALDDTAKAQLEQLALLTDPQIVQAPHSYTELAGLLGLDTAQARLLCAACLAAQADRDAGSLTLAEFTALLNEAAQNPQLAGQFGAADASQLALLAQLSDPAWGRTPRTAAELAQALGLDEAQVQQLLQLYVLSTTEAAPLTLPDFFALLNANLQGEAGAGLDEAQLKQLEQLQALVTAAASGEALTAPQLAAATGLDEATVSALLAQLPAPSEGAEAAATLPDFLKLASTSAAAAGLDEATQQALSTALAISEAAASGARCDAQQLAELTGLDETLVEQLLRLQAAQTLPSLSITDFLNFLLGTVAEDEQYAAAFDEAALQQLGTLQALLQAAQSGERLSAARLAELTGQNETAVRTLLFYNALPADSTGALGLSLPEVLDYLSANAGLLTQEQQTLVSAAQTVLQATGTGYDAESLSALLGLDAAQVQQLYLLHASAQPEADSWTLTPLQFIDFLCDTVLQDPSLSGSLDAGAAQQLGAAQRLLHAIDAGEAYSASELQQLFSGLPDAPDAQSIELAYLLQASLNNYDESWTLSIQALADYLSQQLVNDPRFAPLLDDSAHSAIAAMAQQLDDAAAQLRGEHYTLLMLDTTLPGEGEQTSAFLASLIETCDAQLQGDYYLIGNSVMNYEMEQGFGHEMLLITLLTAIAIFVVVALTFRSLIIPAMLVLLVQCGVFLTVTVIGLQGYSIYYLALLIVQCILMGATIDYSILFTNCYLERRRTLGARDALSVAYRDVIHTILTSGLIMILATGVVSQLFDDPTIGQICLTISIGALCAILLILFVLPGLLAAMDRLLVRRLRK